MGESTLMNEMRKIGADAARLETNRKNLIDLVDLRFPGTMSPEVRLLLEQQESEQMLGLWFRAAATAQEYATFDSVVRE